MESIRPENLIGEGTLAQRPAAAPENKGFLYAQTDSTPGLYRSDGSAWVLRADLGGGGTTLPAADTTAIVKGSADATKQIRFEVDGLSTNQVRVITPPDANTSLPVFAQTVTFTGPTAPRTVSFPDENFTAVGVGTSQTLENKRITRRVASTASASSPAPNSDTTDLYALTALAANATFGAPSGTPTDGQLLQVRIKDNGTARTLSWNAAYRASSDMALPTTTVAGKTMYLGFQWNAADSKWDFVAYLGNY